MAKKQTTAPEVAEPISLREIAEELNEVMQYGIDPESDELVRPEDQIDIDQTDKALMADIIKNATADLRPDDEDAFSQDAWEWFLANGLTPGAGQEEETEPEAKSAKSTKGKEAAPAKPAAKPAAAKPAKPAAEEGEKRGIKKAMVPGGNEAKAIELAKKGCDLDDFIAEFTAIYAAAGNDADYAAKRAKIYFKIGYDRAGLEVPAGPAKAAAKPAAKPATKPAAKPAPEPEEAPVARGRGRR